VTTPLLLLDVLLLSGASIGDTLWIVAADVLMIITGLISAMVHHGQWTWFIIGCIAMVFLLPPAPFPPQDFLRMWTHQPP